MLISKLESAAIKCIFLAYKSGVKGYKLWNPQTRKVVISSNIIFNESVMLPDNLSTDAPVEKSSVQVEHFLNVHNTPNNNNAAVQDAPIIDDPPDVVD